MIDVEIFDADRLRDGPAKSEMRSLCVDAAASMGVADGHVAIEFVDAARIAQLNLRHRGKSGPTDVLSFPIDGADALEHGELAHAREPGGAESSALPPRELGDVVICAEHTSDLREAIVHGMLHLLGLDHETDDGEMLKLQRELLHGAGRFPADA
jgi:probable rRNA maturation factor